MEKSIEKYLKRAIVEMGGLCLKFPPLFYVGFPDRIILLPKGLAIFVELKAQGKVPRPAQVMAHSTLRRLGFRVETLDSKEAVNQFIQTL